MSLVLAAPAPGLGVDRVVCPRECVYGDSYGWRLSGRAGREVETEGIPPAEGSVGRRTNEFEQNKFRLCRERREGEREGEEAATIVLMASFVSPYPPILLGPLSVVVLVVFIVLSSASGSSVAMTCQSSTMQWPRWKRESCYLPIFWRHALTTATPTPRSIVTCTHRQLLRLLCCRSPSVSWIKYLEEFWKTLSSA